MAIERVSQGWVASGGEVVLGSDAANPTFRSNPTLYIDLFTTTDGASQTYTLSDGPTAGTLTCYIYEGDLPDASVNNNGVVVDEAQITDDTTACTASSKTLTVTANLGKDKKLAAVYHTSVSAGEFTVTATANSYDNKYPLEEGDIYIGTSVVTVDTTPYSGR